MAKKFKEIIDLLPRLKKGSREIREILLANLAMISEIPAPTFGEERRVNLMVQRFSECGLQNCSTDEVGNGVALLPGEEDNNILVVAHADTIFPETTDHTMNLRADFATGAGIGDNSLGLAVIVSLPTLLEHLGIELNSTLVLMGATRSHGRGNLEGLNFFLNNKAMPLRAGICVEGCQLGRLSFSSIGMLRGEIVVTVPEEYDWTRFGATGAIITLNDVITRLTRIRLPRRPRTEIIMGSIEGGKAFNTVATQATLRFEIRSESATIVGEISRQINDIIAEVASKTGARIVFDNIARRRPGGISFGHPLARRTRSIIRALKITPRISPSVSELSAFVDRSIPAITIGITRGERLNEPNEVIGIKRIFTGIAQVLGILLAIDGGFCDET